MDRVPADARDRRASQGPVANDGSPVDVYRELPVGSEPDIVHAAVGEAAQILELGCGTGRIAGPLGGLGHRVVGVDDSPEMLAAIDPRVEPVLGDARTARLGRRFDAVLVASHLLNDSDGSTFVVTAAAHLRDGGVLVAEVYPPSMDWPASVGRVTTAGDVEVTIVRARVDGRDVDAEVRYRLRDRTWHQGFTARIRDEAELGSMLADAGLAFDTWLDARRGWFRGVKAPDG